MNKFWKWAYKNTGWFENIRDVIRAIHTVSGCTWRYNEDRAINECTKCGKTKKSME